MAIESTTTAKVVSFGPRVTHESEHYDTLGRGAHGYGGGFRARSVVVRRVIVLLRLLESKQFGITKRELMDGTGLGEKTIERYIRCFEREGVPIVHFERTDRTEPKRYGIMKWR